MNSTGIIVIVQLLNALWGALVSVLFAISDKIECKSSRRHADQVDELRCFSKLGHIVTKYVVALIILSTCLAGSKLKPTMLLCEVKQ